MRRATLPAVALPFCILVLSAYGQNAEPVAEKPLLRVEAAGPASYVTSLVFGPGGNTLYAAGSDKVVRVWMKDPASGQFVLDDRVAYRVPIGPGPEGGINALALSSDGLWLAVAGQSVSREAPGFRAAGEVRSDELKPDSMWLDEGIIYVFDTRTAQARTLRGQRGSVLSLSFAPLGINQLPLLVSAGEEWNATEKQLVGAARVWNIADSRQVAGALLPRPTAGRPGLSVIRFGAGATQIGIGLAWGEGSFRFWDVERQRWSQRSEIQYATQVAYSPELRRFFTNGQQLRGWELQANRELPASPATAVAFSPAGESAEAWAMKIIPTAAGGPQRAAVVCVLPERDGQRQFVLRVVNLSGAGQPSLPDAAIWTAPTMLAKQPVLAASPAGDRIAVSGGPNHEILVYSLVDWQRGPQRIRGVGRNLPFVAFARKENAVGLLLSPLSKTAGDQSPREPRQGDYVFDFTADQLTTDVGGWQAVAQQPSAFQIEWDAATPERPAIVVRERDRSIQRIEVAGASQLSDYAMLPEARLAAAVVIRGQPQLRIYDIGTGAQVGQLTGPVERISCLSVSADGKLIAAASEDQTLNIWGLTDIRRAENAAIAERKPLLTLFLVQPEAGQVGWIGWSPQGPFESSDRQVERHLGWHFNLFQPGRPASFARAEQYREEYFRPGLVRALIETGNIPVPPPMPQPIMSLRVREPDSLRTVDAAEDVLVRTQRLMLEFEAFPYQPNQLDRIVWDAGAGPQPMTWDGRNRQWTADLSGLNLSRGRRQVRISLRTREESPQFFTREVALRVQPPAPEIASPLPPQDRSVNEARFAFQASINTTDGELPASRLIHRHNSQTVTEVDLANQTQINVPLELRPGSNSLEIVAANRDALQNFEEAETSRRTWVISYSPQAVAAPTITLTEIVPVSAGSGTGEPQAAEVGQTVSVAARRVRLQGEIRAAEKLESAEIVVPGADAGRALNGFQANATNALAIAEEFDLQPGSQTVTIRAKTANSVMAEQSLNLLYQPPLPAVALLEPVDQSTFYDGEQPREVKLSAAIAALRDPQTITAAVLVNDRQLPEKPVLDLQSGTLSALVPLDNGDNHIELRISNEWGQSHSEAVQVRYLRPPKIVQVETPTVGAQPLVDVVFFAVSALPVTEATINGRNIPASSISQDGPRWKLTDKVVLQDGVNELALQVSNADGPARKPGSLRIEYHAPAPPPQITLAEREQTVSRPQFRVRFAAKSQTPLKQIELLRDKKVVYSTSDMSKLPADANGWITLPELRLERGLNRFQIQASNDSSKSHPAELTVSYVPQPVRLVADALEAASRPGKQIPGVQRAGGFVNFDAASEADVWLHGRVVWPQEVDATINQEHSGRIWVNGFQQIVQIGLEPRQGEKLERRFKTRLLLNRNENLVQLKLDGLPLDADDRLQFVVNCQSPRTDQTLHLLIIGIGETDQASLETRARQALRITTNARGVREKEGFARVREYACLAGVVSEVHINSQLKRIHDTIRESASGRAGPTNDVVIVYYQGPEVQSSQGRIALATSFPSASRPALGNVLTRFVDNSPGAHLLLLDVARLDTTMPAGYTFWEPDSQLGVLRYAWLRGMQIPADARLLTALLTAVERAQPKGARLGDIESQVASEFAQAQERHPGALVYDKHLPPSMRDLALGALRQ